MARPRRNDATAADPFIRDPQIELGLNAAIVMVRDQQPHILVARPGAAGPGTGDALPFGPFAPRAHRTLEIGLREWVKRQTGIELGYVEQLYTFGDRAGRRLAMRAIRTRSRSAIWRWSRRTARRRSLDGVPGPTGFPGKTGARECRRS